MKHGTFQRGQAMSAYMVLSFSAVMLMLGSGLAMGLSFTPQGHSLEACDLQSEIQSDEQETLADIETSNHTVELSSVVYNEADDTTRVVYTITSGPKSSISHWTLGIPKDIADNIVETSQPISEWRIAPPTGLIGTKFAHDYELENSGNREVSHDIVFLFSGYYSFGPTETTLQAGQELRIASISAPIRLVDPEQNEECG